MLPQLEDWRRGSSPISSLLVVSPLKPRMISIKIIWKGLALFVVKELVSLSYIEAPCFGGLLLKHNPCFNFPSKQVFVNEILHRIIKKTKEKHVYSTFESCNSCIVSFELWMSKTWMDTFVFIVHFLNEF